MKKTLEKAAKAGRYGDNRLLHVSDTELEGLASLHPKGKLPTNPETGLPEAFFFLPFLAGLGSIGAGAATAAAALPAAATAATTAASAIPAAATIGGALGTAALPAAQAATLGATTAASALPAATAAIPAAATSALPAATAALPSATSTLSAATPTLLGSGGLDTLAATTPSMLANPAATTATSLPSVAANPASAPLFKPAMDAALTNAVTPSTLASPSSVVSSAPTSITPAVTPPSTIPGINATTPGATLLGPAPSTTSGIFSGSNMSTMMQGLAPLAAMMGGSDMPEMEEQEAPKLKKTTYHRGKVSFKGSGGDGEHDYFPDDKYKGSKATKRKFAMGGLVKGYAEGGLASLDNSSGEMSDKDLIQATKQALIEQSPDAQQLVAMFLSTFGHTALADLMSAIHQSGEGQPDPMGDGMSDSVPATVTGNDGSQGLASLSEGEFVIPADVVSGLGNGSTEAGARQLDGMMSKVRQHTSNGSKQPEAMNPSDVMPV